MRKKIGFYRENSHWIKFKDLLENAVESMHENISMPSHLNINTVCIQPSSQCYLWAALSLVHNIPEKQLILSSWIFFCFPNLCCWHSVEFVIKKTTQIIWHSVGFIISSVFLLVMWYVRCIMNMTKSTQAQWCSFYE